MKKRVVCCLLFLALLLCAASSCGEGAVTNASCEPLDRLFSLWFYVPGSLPAGIDGISASESLVLETADGQGGRKIPTVFSAELIAGTESFRDAVSFHRSGEGQDSEVWITVNGYALTEPGAGVFRVHLEADQLVFEKEYLLRVFTWDQAPLFSLRNDNSTVYVRLGEGDANIYTTVGLASLLIAENSADIARQLTGGDAAYPYYGGGEIYLQLLGDYSEYQLKTGQTYSGTGYQFRAYGAYEFLLRYRFANVFFETGMTAKALSYDISGPEVVKPGASVQFSVLDREPEKGRSFTWSLQGDGASLDAASGLLSVDPLVPEGTAFTVTAVPSDGDDPVSMRSAVSRGVLANPSFEQYGVRGFLIPYLTNEGMQSGSNARYPVFSVSTDENAPYQLVLDHSVMRLPEFAEEEAVAARVYDDYDLSGMEVFDQKNILIDGHSARLITAKAVGEDGVFEGYGGILLYARNDRILRSRLLVLPREGTDEAVLPAVTLEDLESVAAALDYDPAGAPLTVADGMLTVAAADGADSLTSGKKLQFSAAFASPDKVNRKEKNDTIEWSVTDPLTGETPEGVSISSKGLLAAAKGLDQVLTVQVKASSPVFHTEAVRSVTLLPAVTGISVIPSELTFYVGTDTAQTLTASLEPASAPLRTLTWKPARKDVVEVVPTGDSTAAVTPVAKGKTTVIVSEPGGKQASVPVSVVVPVESLELSARGKPIPGGTVTLNARILPKDAGSKALEWSLDVDDTVASIGPGGQLKIKKTAPEGTVITVTCTASGAPEPVTASIAVEVQ